MAASRARSDFAISTGKADADLDQRLNDELDRFNAAATPDVAPAVELTVRAGEAANWSAVSPAGPGEAPPGSA